jgi:hypothetical protein
VGGYDGGIFAVTPKKANYSTTLLLWIIFSTLFCRFPHFDLSLIV